MDGSRSLLGFVGMFYFFALENTSSVYNFGFSFGTYYKWRGLKTNDLIIKVHLSRLKISLQFSEIAYAESGMNK